MSNPINPYASPQHDGYAPALAANEPRTGPPYQTASGRALVANWTAGFLIFCNVLLLGSFALQMLMLAEAERTGVLDQQAAVANDLRQQGLSVVTMIGAIVSLIALLVWIYAANRNLPSLKPSAKLEFTPGWSVGWFFVPIMNLFKPYQVVREIGNQSDPQRLNPGLYSTSSGAIIGWWWCLRILSAILGRLLSTGAAQNETLDGLMIISWLAVGLIVALDLPMLICQILMVRRIQLNQDERHQIVSTALPAPSALPGTSENPFAQLT